jgi:putative peptidoglycan lipid II flippase
VAVTSAVVLASGVHSQALFILGILVAAAILAILAYGLWRGLDGLLGRSLPAQIVSVGAAIALGSAAYAATVLALKIPEAKQVRDLFASRLT